MIPELVITLLACARIGAIHSVVFGGFSAEALRDRIRDSRSKTLVTCNYSCGAENKSALKKTPTWPLQPVKMWRTASLLKDWTGSVP